jgi:dTDP-4-amino-4,6-dideoxygalactose transaminase
MKRLISPLEDELCSSLRDNIQRSLFIMGPDVEEFENNFSKAVNTKYSVSMSNGTDSLLATLMSLGLEPGDEVLVPSFTFVSSASVILRAGLKPVFVDIEKDSFHMCIKDVEKKYTDKTKAIIFVHLFGEIFDLSNISNFCNNNDLFLIEDCAQAFGAFNKLQGDAASFSFFPAKNLGCLGDGGAVCVDNEVLCDRLRKIRSHGSSKRYVYEMLGGNFRMDTIQAGFLNIILKQSDDWVSKRISNANFYNDRLKNILKIKIPNTSLKHSYNQYTIITDVRDELAEFLKGRGISTAVYYPKPLHCNDIFLFEGKLPETERRCGQVLSIPIYPGLREDEREYVSNNIIEFYDDS